MKTISPRTLRLGLLSTGVLALDLLGTSGAFAAEDDTRIVPQIMVGTAGFEPGVALEWRVPELIRVVFRPEVFLSEDHRLGGGGSILYEVNHDIGLPRTHQLCIGPRFVAHNSDDTGWEIDAMATYAVALGQFNEPWRHAVGAIAAGGLKDDRQHDETNVGGSVGAFYSFRF